MDLQLNGKHALISGASSGIGRATAEALAFLISGRSGYTSGSIMTIDAGLSARANFT